MRIQRNYSKSIFNERKRRKELGVRVLLYIFLLIGFIAIIDNQFSQLQLVALQFVGQAPAPTPFASELANEGMQRYASGNLRDALNLLQRAVQQQPNNVDYLYEYGKLLLEMGDIEPRFYGEAVSVGDQAINTNPNDPRGYTLKARALTLSGDPAGSIPIAQSGLMVNRSFAPLYAALSDAYRRIDRYDVAIENAEHAVELDPLDPYARRIYSYALTWVGRFDESIYQLEQAIMLNPHLAGPYFELAGLYRYQAQQAQDTQFALERYADSIALYEQVIALQPENARAYLRLCEVYFEAQENVRATDYCLDATRLDPNYMEAWASLGQTQYSRRNFEGAIESLERCATLGGEQADLRCYYIRGLAHFYLGNCDNAWSILTYSLNRIRAGNPDPDNTVLLNIEFGIRLIIDNCAAYRNELFPTSVPPTAIPPTLIGG